MNNDYAFILAVSTGEGISELMLELGADAVLSCIDADALSDADFRTAILASDARRLLILPNSVSAAKAAKNAASSLRSDARDLRVVPTESIAEGYAALAAMPRGGGTDELYSAAESALSAVTPIEVKRESGADFFDKYSAISRGERYALAGGAEAALFEAVEQIFSSTHRIITIIVGRGVTNARRVFVTERLGELYPDAQIIVYIGGQTATEYYIALR